MLDMYQVRVFDLRKKYRPALYTDIQAENTTAAEVAGLERYLAENNHPPRKPKERGSAYYGKFWVEAVSASETAGT